MAKRKQVTERGPMSAPQQDGLFGGGLFGPPAKAREAAAPAAETIGLDDLRDVLKDRDGQQMQLPAKVVKVNPDGSAVIQVTGPAEPVPIPQIPGIVVYSKKLHVFEKLQGIVMHWTTPHRGEVGIVQAEHEDVQYHRQGTLRFVGELVGVSPATPAQVQAWGWDAVKNVDYHFWQFRNVKPTAAIRVPAMYGLCELHTRETVDCWR